jgi:hypothetical protein
MTTPDASESWIDPIFDAVVSNIQRTGYFDKVNTHEPKRAPGSRLTAAVWIQSVIPTVVSGINSTSAVMTFIIRIYQNFKSQPEDMIDPSMLRAACNIIRQFHDDFDFDLPDLIRNVDLLRMSLNAGYVEQDKSMFRVMDIMIPVIVNDVWPQIT